MEGAGEVAALWPCPGTSLGPGIDLDLRQRGNATIQHSHPSLPMGVTSGANKTHPFPELYLGMI